MPPPAETTQPEAFKDWFNPTLYREIADQLASVCPAFDRKQFLQLTLEGLESRSLMERLRQTPVAAHAALPGSYAEKLQVLEKLAARSDHNFVGIWFAEFAGRYGTDDPTRALAAMRHFTQFGSAEFAIRPYIQNDPKTTLATLLKWTRDDNEHVRRLASEGSRPRLPWGLRLGFLVEDPSPTRPILEALKADPSLYVRKSVANHLNDIAKDHPNYVVALVRDWDRDNPLTAWIVKRGLRTLVKNGHPAALELMGAGQAPKLDVATFTAAPTRLTLGTPLQLEAELRSTSRKTQQLIVDYIVHYVKANGSTSPKVFKWKELSLAPGETLSLRKRQTIQDFSTRRHYAGHHRIELQINGQILARTGFDLRR
ncbi:DNA alkylation repair protein [Actomonas aquatica]|uniref:DNA alkylation repair protein n=1 Tax=Actomonas aquatica TaxID=2866162 RepID=A0ABZ1C8Z2_9BACT|nr:DNA alkylation repair protein [Opitutus sp. WL0086]WRQ88166.1 DNA alkylation repair protein [Opitutus sp. WL0086]